jgi:hypothetical protein
MGTATEALDASRMGHCAGISCSTGIGESH